MNNIHALWSEKKPNRRSVRSDTLTGNTIECLFCDKTNHYYTKFLGRRRENKENEKNTEDFKSERSSSAIRLGRGMEYGRSARGGRGGGRSLGPRTFASRKEATLSHLYSFTRPIDIWTGDEEQIENSKESKIGECQIIVYYDKNFYPEYYPIFSAKYAWQAFIFSCHIPLF